MSFPMKTPLGACQDRSGFLFSHDCPRNASAMCTRCGMGLCEQHSHMLDAEVLCTSCAKQAREEDSEHEGDSEPSGWEDDPYLYSSYHYEGYGYYGRGYWGHEHDPHDFTEADGESLLTEGHGDFEEDMGGS